MGDAMTGTQARQASAANVDAMVSGVMWRDSQEAGRRRRPPTGCHCIHHGPRLRLHARETLKAPYGWLGSYDVRA